jgi:hypothetical protein
MLKKLSDLEAGGWTTTDDTVMRQIDVLQQRLKDTEGRGGEHGLLNYWSSLLTTLL